ncbi:MAG: histidine kinase [Sulfuricella sp.]|nr:histidine kinase [Sulfuricella sp.]
MTPPAHPDSPRRFVQEALFVVFGNSAIALFLAAVNVQNFRVDFIYSQCLGLAIFLTIRGLCMLRRRTKPGLLETALGIPLGGFVGFALATWSNGLTLAEVMENYPQAAEISAAGAVFFGAIAAYYFYAHSRLVEAEAEARNERLRRMEHEALAARAELRLLQAQIEPHFLFNTLSNAVGLIDENPAAARTLLLDLSALLRVALKRSNREDTSLAEELDFTRAYLGIMALRMGERLQWRIDAAPEIGDIRVPPLLLQPLVENALRHGLEAKPAGGALLVTCRRNGTSLEIAVTDNGLGLGATCAGHGIGLANVRARLASRYGAAATLQLRESPSGGVAAILVIPLEKPSCAS